MWDWIKENPGFAIGGVYVVAELVVALTPTKKDDAIFDILRGILRKRIPRLKKGGGKDDSALKMIRKSLFALLNIIPRLKKGGGKFN